MSTPVNVRAEAARVIASVLAGRSLDDALAAPRASLREPKDQALLQALAFGVLREHAQLAAIAGQMLERPLDEQPALHALILVGLFQLKHLRVPPHAAVAATVDGVEALAAPRMRGLVNALLRRFQREQKELEAAIPQVAALEYSYPDWLLRAIRADWPERWRAVCAAGNQQAPMTLRINRRKTTRPAYALRLKAAGISARDVACAGDALVLEEPLGVEQLPGFAQGAASVQDVSAQLAVSLLAAENGQRVLDACAAPGGKSAHILERADVALTALDRDSERLPSIQNTLTRLGLQARVQMADAGDPAAWWDGEAFDRILLDAPCSGTGVIRRHPDIKWLRRERDVQRMAQEQARLLAALWPMLAPGGVLLYAVCSILSAEGEAVIRQFLARTADAKHDPIAADWGQACKLGRRIEPGGDHDGFYYVRLRRPMARRSG